MFGDVWSMTQFYKCTRCGREAEIDTEKYHRQYLRCNWIYSTKFDINKEAGKDIRKCGGKLEPVSKGENDVQKCDFIN